MTTQRIYRTGAIAPALPVDETRIRDIAYQTADDLPDIEPVIRGAIRDIESFTNLKIFASQYEALFDSAAFVQSHTAESLVLPGVNAVLTGLSDSSGTVDPSRYRVYPIDFNGGVQIVPLADWDFADGIVSAVFTAGSTGSQVPEHVTNLIGVQTRYSVHGEPDDYDLVRDMTPEVIYREVA